jgi:hypothetical protein
LAKITGIRLALCRMPVCRMADRAAITAIYAADVRVEAGPSAQQLEGYLQAGRHRYDAPPLENKDGEAGRVKQLDCGRFPWAAASLKVNGGSEARARQLILIPLPIQADATG